MFPEGKATEEKKKEKGHAYFRKAKRQRSKKRERSRMFPEAIATEVRKMKKVTHISRRQSDRGVKKEKGHYFAG